MAVDYTKLFTIIGKPAKLINDYYGLIATHATNKTALDAILVAQSLSRLIDTLDTVDKFEKFKADSANWVSSLVETINAILADSALVTSNFGFGSTPGVQTLLARLIKDMYANSQHVAAPTTTVNAVTKTTYHATAGDLAINVKLDGVTPPIAGATAVREYADVTSLLLPDDETLTFTCVQDSENGGQRGNEQFDIAGTGTGSSPYSVDGENVGNAGRISVQDVGATNYMLNPSFDTWESGADPTSWTIEEGTINVDYERSASPMYSGDGNSYALKTIQANNDFSISQILDPTRFTRLRGYFLSAWSKKVTDAAGDQSVSVIFSSGGFSKTILIEPTTTTWTLSRGQIIIPNELDDEINLLIDFGNLDSTNDPILIDQIVIQPCTYVAGVAVALCGGPLKFLIGDQFSVRLQNSGSSAKFHTVFRKAFRVSLPTSGSPSISEALVT